MGGIPFLMWRCGRREILNCLQQFLASVSFNVAKRFEKLKCRMTKHLRCHHIVISHCCFTLTPISFNFGLLSVLGCWNLFSTALQVLLVRS
ncbi:hypothetical protein NC652_036776 [Populus alba x Populus x berolinensis]|nr:hypothetical protein NC652_036776 [Populus alba x Populus x berolinensis]